ncbi:MAG: hypothetical protein MR021_05175 [Clostridiales bacterium]|nr:hypothetical protein [Clostridiales bacterium]
MTGPHPPFPGSDAPEEDLPRSAKEQDPFFETMKTASVTECTGLAPSALENGWQQGNIAGLYAIHALKRQEADDDMSDEDWPR